MHPSNTPNPKKIKQEPKPTPTSTSTKSTNANPNPPTIINIVDELDRQIRDPPALAQTSAGGGGGGGGGGNVANTGNTNSGPRGGGGGGWGGKVAVRTSGGGGSGSGAGTGNSISSRNSTAKPPPPQPPQQKQQQQQKPQRNSTPPSPSPASKHPPPLARGIEAEEEEEEEEEQDDQYPSKQTFPHEVEDEEERLSSDGDGESGSLGLETTRGNTTINANTSQMQIPTASINDRNPTPSPSPALSPSPTPPPQEPSGLDTLNGGMRKMVDMVNKLRAAGIEGLGLGLPRIAVVGNQSAGKSSLIEAISGIKVPRYTGTCTRCPLEINLSDATPTPSSRSPADPTSPSPSWHCKISLRFNKQYNPSCGGLGRGNNPWVDQPIQQHLFMEVTNKDDVERALVKAQRAILNPSRSWQEFVNGGGAGGDHSRNNKSGGGGGGGRKEEEDFEVKFSPNVVCMEISGRGLPNLAFIDLPGVIQTTEAESEDYLIDLVTGLVKEYVREKDCLILLAMTMRDDAVNQSAARLAREMGEERTIGALTKPDTVCPGEFKQWIEILRGKAHRLKHGYFVTKQPSQDQLLKGITHAEARKAEDQFFATTEPWATELQDMTERFGTVALTRYLAAELGERIRLRLPGIVETIKCQADDVQHELDSFPAPAIDNHFFVIQNLLTKFGLAVEEYIQGGGGGDRNKLQTGLKAFARELGKVIDAGRPRIHWAQTEEEELAAPPPLPQNFTANRGNRDGGRGLDVISVESGDSKQPRKRNRNNTSPAGEPPSSTFTLMQLNRISEAHSNGQIPDQVSSKAIEFLARQTLLGWRPCIFRYLDDCQRLLISILSELFHRKFECYQKTPLFAKSHEIIDRYLETAFRTQTKTTISRIYRLEQEQIATADEKTFKAAKARHLDRLLEARQRNKEEQREAKRRRLNLDTLPLRKRQHEEKKLLQDEEKDSNGRTYDRFAIEIELMAGTRAYYDLASRRFVDNVFMSVLGEWIAGVKEGLQEELWTGLGFGEGDVHEKAKSLLEEDPEKERRRRELEIKGEKLRRAMEELNRL